MAAINRALDELQRASQAMAEHLYGGAKTGPAPVRPRSRAGTEEPPNGGPGG